MQSKTRTAVEKSPRALLVCLFLAWKVLLLTIALLGPGADYDTSTQLLLRGYGVDQTVDASSPLFEAGLRSNVSQTAQHVVNSLTRWDAIYFASTAERGYVFEQEWAFGWGFSRLLSLLSRYIPVTSNSLHDVAIHGILLAHACHLLAVLLLYQLVLTVVPITSASRTGLAFIASALHIVSPAGIFLVAPYTESPFAFLNFLGQLLYVCSWPRHGERYGITRDIALIASALAFGLSATLRGNGLLSGLLFFNDLVVWLVVKAEAALGVRLINLARSSPALQANIRSIDTRRLPATIFAGILLAIGFAGPQYIAYHEFCGPIGQENPPWCQKFPPSIYSWVQSHYWNVGFLKYWTLSNAPLFLIASPVMYMMLRSGWQALQGTSTINSTRTKNAATQRAKGSVNMGSVAEDALLLRLALPQFTLACAALTTFHVQVITRLSSGYPLWYIALASDIYDRKWTAQSLVRWFVMYALVQGALFAKFLPPA